MPTHHKTHTPIALTLCLLLALLTACTTSKSNLQREDYNVYLDGKKAVEFKEGDTFRIDANSEEPYETFRGVKIGSRVEDVEKAYDDCIVYAENGDVERIGNEKASLNFAQFLKKTPILQMDM